MLDISLHGKRGDERAKDRIPHATLGFYTCFYSVLVSRAACAALRGCRWMCFSISLFYLVSVFSFSPVPLPILSRDIKQAIEHTRASAVIGSRER